MTTSTSQFTVDLTCQPGPVVHLNVLHLPAMMGENASALIFWNDEFNDWDFRLTDQYLPKRATPAALVIASGSVIEFGSEAASCAIDEEMLQIAVLTARQAWLAMEAAEYDAIDERVQQLKDKRVADRAAVLGEPDHQVSDPRSA